MPQIADYLNFRADTQTYALYMHDVNKNWIKYLGTLVPTTKRKNRSIKFQVSVI